MAYLPISPVDEVAKIKGKDFTQAIVGLGAIGGAILKDIKGKVIPYLDELLDELADEVQSVNTVIRKGSKLIGYNTDAHGFEQAIRKGIEGKSIETALVYGYGGVFNVVYHVLTRIGLQVSVTGGRRPEAVQQTNEQYGLEPYDGQPWHLFVNASPVTDRPLEEAPGFLEAVAGLRIAFDHEMPGKYLAHCEDHGIQHIPGTKMYSSASDVARVGFCSWLSN